MLKLLYLADCESLKETGRSIAGDRVMAAELIKLRFFAGLSLEDAAEIVGFSRSTAYEHWAYARAWLHRRIRDRPGEERV
jgi:hypothetical protein